MRAQAAQESVVSALVLVELVELVSVSAGLEQVLGPYEHSQQAA